MYSPHIARWIHLVLAGTLLGGFQMLLAPEAEAEPGSEDARAGDQFPLFDGFWTIDKTVAVVLLAITGIYSAIYVYLPQWRRVPVLNASRRRYWMMLGLKTFIFLPVVIFTYAHPTLISFYVCWFLLLVMVGIANYMKHIRETALEIAGPANAAADGTATDALSVHITSGNSNIAVGSGPGPFEKRVIVPFKHKKGVCDQTDPAHVRVASPAHAASAGTGSVSPSSGGGSGSRFCPYCASEVDIRHDAMCRECSAKYGVCHICALHLKS